MVYKLTPSDEKIRKLKNARNLWNEVLKIKPIFDVFKGEAIIIDNYDLDHFIPWSFVMNYELWNLMPMDSSLKSSKNNKLPIWDLFFDRFADNQFILYETLHERPGMHKLFEARYRDNLHSIWANQELYKKGNSKEEFRYILSKNMKPVYDSARRQGYEVWNI
ncbi:MAG: HNH endonuclease domain-containing protein [Erysipelotrichaceae bacterium]